MTNTVYSLPNNYKFQIMNRSKYLLKLHWNFVVVQKSVVISLRLIELAAQLRLVGLAYVEHLMIRTVCFQCYCCDYGCQKRAWVVLEAVLQHRPCVGSRVLHQLLYVAGIPFGGIGQMLVRGFRGYKRLLC